MSRVDNPVLPGCHPDPSICRVGEHFYLATSSFHTWPGIPLFHSRDLAHWRPIGHVFTRPSQLDLSGCPSGLGLFAPTLRHHGGRFHLVTTVVHQRRNVHLWAERAEGPWSDPVTLDWPGIDPSLCFLADGRVLITGNGGFHGDEPKGIYQAQIDLDSGRLLSPRRLIWAGSGAKAPEGPHLYAVGQAWLLLIAEGGTEAGHMVTVARSDHPFGPFEPCPHNPVLSHRSLDHALQCTGHADLVQGSDGRWWAVLLATRPAPVPFAPQRHHLGRETCVLPLQWDAKGWPQLGLAGTGWGRVPLQLPAEALPPLQPWPQPALAASGMATAEAPDRLSADWSVLRTPLQPLWSLSQRPGWLLLYGQSATLDDEAATPAFVGRWQTQFDCVFSARLQFQPQADGEEAGLVVYANERFHHQILLRRQATGCRLLLRRRLGSLWREDDLGPAPEGDLALRIVADAREHRYLAGPAGGPLQPLGTTECAMLSAEVAGGFTGVMLGLYASGRGRPASVPAAFTEVRLDLQP
ncbi:MAG: glycoside hydrolase family 43 protein [Burkholderiaceae bacterium]|nr:glycoside hydrolase family 43 protein [Burkholderiaceae bacterium]